jgi:sterol desaturase/sphingolipid hydroxylase (fatty acid hydroxylase superfamily)
MMYSILGVQWDMFQFSLLLVFKSLVEIGGHLGRCLAPSSSCPQFFYLPKWLGIELYVEDHDLHHTHFNCNYAKRFAIWDKLFGTYRTSPHLMGNYSLMGKYSLME